MKFKVGDCVRIIDTYGWDSQAQLLLGKVGIIRGKGAYSLFLRETEENGHVVEALEILTELGPSTGLGIAYVWPRRLELVPEDEAVLWRFRIKVPETGEI
jgi:hypothetical protein